MIHLQNGNDGGEMRGTDETSRSLFSYVDLEERIPPRHPLRKIRQVVNDALASLDGEFEALYTDSGRPSIPPERLIRAGLLQILFSIRSERQLGDYFSVLLRPPSGQLLAQVSPVRGAWTAQSRRWTRSEYSAAAARIADIRPGAYLLGARR